MTITDVEIDDSNITFSLSGEMSLGSAPVVSLLIRSSQRMGLSVHLDISAITGLDAELLRYLSQWRTEGVTLSSAGLSQVILNTRSQALEPAGHADTVEVNLHTGR